MGVSRGEEYMENIAAGNTLGPNFAAVFQNGLLGN